MNDPKYVGAIRDRDTGELFGRELDLWDRFEVVTINAQSGEVIPADEPTFLFRARDRKALAALYQYVRECENIQHRNAVHERVMEFIDFKEAHPERMKEPDTDTGAPAT